MAIIVSQELLEITKRRGWTLHAEKCGEWNLSYFQKGNTRISQSMAELQFRIGELETFLELAEGKEKRDATLGRGAARPAASEPGTAHPSPSPWTPKAQCPGDAASDDHA